MSRKTAIYKSSESLYLDVPAGTKISGAEALLHGLKAHGITRIFGYPGGAILPVYDALYSVPELEHVLFRHEQGCIHAAQGYARTLRETAVVIVTSGPGATNIITGLGDALLDSTPLVCITGQVPSSLLGTDAFQETDVVGCTMSVTKWNTQITKAEDLPAALEKAFYVANSGRPGPVLIDITKDAQVGKFEYTPTPPQVIRSYIAKPSVPEDAIKAAAELMNKAKRPLIFAGHGVQISGAVTDFRAMLGNYQAPTLCTLQGLGNISFDHKCSVGMAGIYGHIAANRLLDEVDLVIALGMRFDDRVTGKTSLFAPNAKVIHIEIDESEINKNIKATVPVWADLKEALALLNPLLEARTFPTWFKKLRALDKLEEKEVRNKVIAPPFNGYPTMEQVIATCSKYAQEDAIMTADVGQHQMVSARYFDYRQPNRWLSSGGAGTMGFSLPAAIGAQFAAPNQQVICIAGDGGFQMTAQELGTAFEHKLPVKVIVLDNNRLGMVRQVQDTVLGGRVFGVQMINPSFTVLAKAYEWESFKISKAHEVEDAIKKLFATEGPALLHVLVDPKADIYPVVPFGKTLGEIQLGPETEPK